MGREIYQQAMEQRLRDLSLQIESVKERMGDASGGLRRQLDCQMALLEGHRDVMREKLDALSDEPDGTWEDLKAEVEDEWDSLVQDFEEKVASLA